MFKKKKNYIILIIIIAIIGSVFYFKSKKPVVQYTTTDVTQGNLVQTVSVTGKVASPMQADLSFKMSGRVEAIYVDVGDHVAKGDKIATIDKGTLQSQLDQEQANLKSQKEALNNLKKRDNLYNKPQRDAQRAEIANAEGAISEIMDQFKELTIYSPIDGIIINKGVEAGETIVANSAAGNAPVVTIAEDGDLLIQSNVPESDIVKVTLGQKADVTLDAFTPQDIFPAKVTEIDPASTVIQDVVYYKVKLGFDAADQRFKNGMTANVDIHTAQKDNVFYIPERAIKDDNGRKYVEILTDEKNNIISRAYVTTGLLGDDGMIEITSGLTGGEKVVTFTKTP